MNSISSSWLTEKILLILGYVALIVGGVGHGPAVEVYSPDGKCQHQLASIPTGGLYQYVPTLAYIDGKILSCAGIGSGNATVSKNHE